jgi:CRP/FNR family transcriptional regulator, nitrogen oxide reductase regulator
MPATLTVRALSTFHALDEDIVAYCLQHAALASAKRGELLIRQGERATLVYVIRTGYAKLVSMSPDGHEVMVGIVGPRDVFGQAAVVREERDYAVTATALTPMQFAIWSRAKGLELAERFPEIHARLDAQLVQNLGVLLARIHSVSEGRVSRRMARVLLELAARHGEPRPPGIAILPPLTRQDLAALTGTTLYSASRLLADWEHRGVLATSRGNVRIRDVAALTAIAETPET